MGTLLQLPFDQHIKERADWLIGLRWIVLTSAAVAVLLGNGLLRLSVPSPAIWATIAAVAAYNLIFYAISRSSPMRNTRIGVQAQLLRIQVMFDMFALTALLQFSGGVEDPFSAFYLLLVLTGSILMTRKDSYIFATLSVLLWAGLLILEGTGVIPHYNLQGFRLPTRYQEWSHIGAEIVVLTSAAYITSYLSSSVVMRLRDSERRLFESNRACQLRAQELDSLNARLQEMDRTRTQFLRLVTHELRAPVAAIQSYLRLIIEGYVPPENTMDIITKAEQRANDQLDLIADLLDLAHLQDRPAPTVMQRCDAIQVMRDVLDLMQARMGDKSLTTVLEIPEDAPPVCGNQEQIKRIWTNLISNAVKYTPDGGRITITVDVDGDYLKASVQDTGIGMSPEEQQHIFEEFYRTERAKEFCRHGTGLGLSIVRGIVEGCGGQLTVQSQVNQGSTFTFTLPLAQSTAEGEASRPC